MRVPDYAARVQGRGEGAGNTINQCDLNMNLLKLHLQTFILVSFLFGINLFVCHGASWRECAPRRLEERSLLKRQSNLCKHNLKLDLCDTPSKIFHFLLIPFAMIKGTILMCIIRKSTYQLNNPSPPLHTPLPLCSEPFDVPQMAANVAN